MKRAELKVGETYVSATVGYDRNNFHGLPAIVLDLNVDSSRNGFDYRIRRPTPNPRTGKTLGNKVLALMEGGPSQDRVSRMGAEQFQPTAEWVDRWMSVFGKPWPNEAEKAERRDLNEQIPKGWNIVAIPPSRLWMPWSEFVFKRDEFKKAEVIREQDRIRRLGIQESNREELENLAEAAGLHSFTVARDARTITIPAEQFRALVKQDLRATA